ncbi:unnamed protein product [Phyllotreta striolata]|uniref:Uncharacterized protein n=1 Tax=Phyllotreta striolata TaxID=444603 RepID=A0A9N9TST9_PHYSR|nr:unnamed protein product [Phyllotreta striolata]
MNSQDDIQIIDNEIDECDEEELIKDIKERQLEIKHKRQILDDLRNKMIVEELQKHQLERKLIEYREEINFNKKHVASNSKRLIRKKRIGTKFELARECFKRVLILDPEEEPKPLTQFDLDFNSTAPKSKNNCTGLLKEIQENNKHFSQKIQENFKKLDSLVYTPRTIGFNLPIKHDRDFKMFKIKRENIK